MILAAIYIYGGSLPHIFGENHSGQTINFGSKFFYTFEENSNYEVFLKEKKENTKFMNFFWHSDIKLVSSIVGENGTGKTTVLNFFRELYPFCKFIYETDKDEYIISSNTEINEVIYYSSFLNINQSNSESGNFRDLSRYQLMIDDTEHENLDLSTLFELHKSENLKRWIKFINFNKKTNLLNEISLPIFDKIKIKINSIQIDPYQTSYRFRPFFESLKEKIDKERADQEQIIIDEIGLEEFQKRKSGQKIRLELEIIRRVISKVQNILESSGNKYLEEGFIHENRTKDYEEFKNAKNAKEAFYWFLENSFIQLSKNSKKILFPVEDIKNLLETTLSYIPDDKEIENWTEFNVNFSQALDITNAYEKFLISFKNNFSYDKKILMTFSPAKNISSGEKGLYDLFSVLHDYNYRIDNDIHIDFSIFNKSKRISNDFLVLLDEADLGFHPDWKKKYINIIQKVIPRIFKKKNIQIIITTHDPLTLSDIPNTNVIYLKKEKQITKVLDFDDLQRPTKTFGANISDLLADSFFVNDGLIGDFAKEKIEKTIEWINVNRESKDRNIDTFTKELEYHKRVINIIDEPVVKIKLSEMISELEDKNDFQKKIIDEEIKFLTNKRNNLK